MRSCGIGVADENNHMLFFVLTIKLLCIPFAYNIGLRIIIFWNIC